MKYDELNFIADYLIYSIQDLKNKYDDSVLNQAITLINSILIENNSDKKEKVSLEFLFFCINNNLNLSFPRYYNNYKGIKDDNLLLKNIFLKKDLFLLKNEKNLKQILMDLDYIKNNGIIGKVEQNRQKGHLFRQNLYYYLSGIQNDGFSFLKKNIKDFDFFDDNLSTILNNISESKLLKSFNIETNIDLKDFDRNLNTIILASDKRNQEIFTKYSDHKVNKGLDIIINIGNPSELGFDKNNYLMIGGEAKEINQGGGAQNHQYKNMIDISKMIGNNSRGIGIYSGTLCYSNEKLGKTIKESLDNKELFHISDLIFYFDDVIKYLIKKE